MNDDIGIESQFEPSISMNWGGKFIIAWVDWNDGNSDIYCQRFNSSGKMEGVNFKVNDDVGIAEQHIPSIAIDNNGNFIIVWQDGRNDWQSDIYYQCYDSSGKKQGTNIKVNDDVGIVSKTHPSIVMDGGGNFVIVWIDARNFKNDIYFQYYNHDGTPRGTNVKVNDEIGTINFILQSIAMDVDGKFVIVWQDHRY